jgi:TonB family protein
MPADWKQLEGQVVNGFALQRFLGGSERHAVFVVEKSAGGQSQTAVRLVDANSDDAREQFERWEAASKLNHPNLLRIFRTGRCAIDGRDFFYAWTEYGEEDLSQIIPTRALSVAETRQILDAVLPALTYIHGQGLVHGSLKPSNIFAVGETVKIASDSIRRSGKPIPQPHANSKYDAPEAAKAVMPPADVWSLGVTLVEIMTQRLPIIDARPQKQPVLPSGIPQEFKEIVENCLRLDPARRWTVEQITARLRGTQANVQPRTTAATRSAHRETSASLPTAPERGQSAKWIYVLALAAAVVVAAVLIVRPKSARTPSESPSRQAQSESPAPAKPSPSPQQAEPSGSSETTAPTGEGHAGNDQMATVDTRDDVLERVAPRISPGAQRTITGMIRVLVRLHVDAAGNVTEARLQSAGPSKYFSRAALEAARAWKFKPAIVNGQPAASQWTLRFGFSRRRIEAAAQRTEP